MNIESCSNAQGFALLIYGISSQDENGEGGGWAESELEIVFGIVVS